MLYKKPKDVRYVDMCIYIDDHIYTDQYDEELVFEYLYLITNMLAKQGRFFDHEKDYEDFCASFASQMYMRLISPKQKQFKDDGTPKLPQIKSVLNYIKQCIYPRRLQWEKDKYETPIEMEDEMEQYEATYTFSDMLTDSVTALDAVEFETYLRDITNVTQSFMSRIPYERNSIMYKNIYISCLLTFLSSITLNRNDIQRIRTLEKSSVVRPSVIEDIYRSYAVGNVILFHLPETMTGYIQVLTKELKNLISKDLSESMHTYVPSSCGMRAIAVAQVNNSKIGAESEG